MDDEIFATPTRTLGHLDDAREYEHTTFVIGRLLRAASSARLGALCGAGDRVEVNLGEENAAWVEGRVVFKRADGGAAVRRRGEFGRVDVSAHRIRPLTGDARRAAPVSRSDAAAIAWRISRFLPRTTPWRMAHEMVAEKEKIKVRLLDDGGREPLWVATDDVRRPHFLKLELSGCDASGKYRVILCPAKYFERSGARDAAARGDAREMERRIHASEREYDWISRWLRARGKGARDYFPREKANARLWQVTASEGAWQPLSPTRRRTTVGLGPFDESRVGERLTFAVIRCDGDVSIGVCAASVAEVAATGAHGLALFIAPLDAGVDATEGLGRSLSLAGAKLEGSGAPAAPEASAMSVRIFDVAAMWEAELAQAREGGCGSLGWRSQRGRLKRSSRLRQRKASGSGSFSIDASTASGGAAAWAANAIDRSWKWGLSKLDEPLLLANASPVTVRGRIENAVIRSLFYSSDVLHNGHASGINVVADITAAARAASAASRPTAAHAASGTSVATGGVDGVINVWRVFGREAPPHAALLRVRRQRRIPHSKRTTMPWTSLVVGDETSNRRLTKCVSFFCLLYSFGAHYSFNLLVTLTQVASVVGRAGARAHRAT
jgi:hypothetical protein